MATNIHTQTLLTLPLELRNISTPNSSPLSALNLSRSMTTAKAAKYTLTSALPFFAPINRFTKKQFAICITRTPSYSNSTTNALSYHYSDPIVPLPQMSQQTANMMIARGSSLPIRISAQQSTKDFIKTIAGTSRRFQVQGQYIRMFCAA